MVRVELPAGVVEEVVCQRGAGTWGNRGGLKEAVAPVGRPLAPFKLTEPVKPFKAAALIV